MYDPGFFLVGLQFGSFYTPLPKVKVPARHPGPLALTLRG